MKNSLFPREPAKLGPEVWHLPDWLNFDQQRDLIIRCRQWFLPPAGAARPRMPNGSMMSVETVCLGWYWHPYRYSRRLADTTGERVKPFPDELGRLARRAIEATYGADKREFPPGQPDAAIVNRYAGGAKMGMHQDNEEPIQTPVISISLGASCLFRFGNTKSRNRPWTDVELGSGDLFVFGGPDRRAFHGVTRVNDDGHPLTESGERFNITIRTVVEPRH